MLQATETVVAFESPRRLPDSLAALAGIAPDRPAAVCRELSKLHEEIARGTLSELARRFREDVRGEIVLVLGPAADRRRRGGGTCTSPSTPCAAWSSRARARAPRPRSSPRSRAPAPNELYTALDRPRAPPLAGVLV